MVKSGQSRSGTLSAATAEGISHLEQAGQVVMYAIASVELCARFEEGTVSPHVTSAWHLDVSS